MMHDDIMIHKKKKNKQNLIGVFPGPLQSTPLTRNLAPRFHLKVRGREVNYRIFRRRVDLLDTTNKSSCSMLIGRHH